MNPHHNTLPLITSTTVGHAVTEWHFAAREAQRLETELAKAHTEQSRMMLRTKLAIAQGEQDAQFAICGMVGKQYECLQRRPMSEAFNHGN